LVKIKLIIFLVAIASLSLVFSACQPASGPVQAQIAASVSAEPPPSSDTPSSPANVKFVGELSLSPAHAPIGAAVSASGIGFEPNTDVELVWQGFEGSWNVADGSYNGRDFKADMQSLAKLTTDSGGDFQTTFTVPAGFGFSHDVIVQKGDTIQNKSNFNVDMQVSISPSTGPVGTPINIDAKGIGWRKLENSWTVIYDNKFTGFLSSVTTGGTAHASIPAAGTPGKHIIQIIHGSMTFPYMNMQQSPRPERPSWTFEFTITDGTAVQPLSVDKQSLPIEKGTSEPSSTEPSLWTDIVSGTVGTPVILQGSNLSAGKEIELLWFRVTGNRVSGQGWDETSTSLGKVTVAADGTIKFPFQALDDLGGTHRIEAQVDGTKVAETTFTITPSAYAISPSSGPAGTTITIHIKGVGWTETANIYNLVYDNAYVGYACGFNSQGDVTVYLPATGEPGYHYIDLYPGIYKGNEMSGTDNFRIPQLTAADDHPGEHLPVFRFAFQITED
jgi:hypothetical protein